MEVFFAKRDLLQEPISGSDLVAMLDREPVREGCRSFLGPDGSYDVHLNRRGRSVWMPVRVLRRVTEYAQVERAVTLARAAGRGGWPGRRWIGARDAGPLGGSLRAASGRWISVRWSDLSRTSECGWSRSTRGPDTDGDPLQELTELVTSLDPALTDDAVLAALGRATVRPAGRRRPVSAYT